MGIESNEPTEDLNVFRDTLDSENVAFVDVLNDGISALVENTPDIDYILGDVSLERAKELHKEGKALLEELEGDLEVADGTVLDREG